MSETAEARLKRLAMRSWRRGTKEMDLILGPFADARLGGMSAEALDRYARDPALRERHGAAGLDFARTMDWDRINSVVLDVYERAIERLRRFARLNRR